jgi:hypothetical protein
MIVGPKKLEIPVEKGHYDEVSAAEWAEKVVLEDFLKPASALVGQS